MFLKHNKLWIVSKIIFSDTNIFFELKAAWMMLITKPSFVHSTHSIHSLTKKEQHQRHVEYIRDLKARTKCYHCGITSQWSADCKKPRKKHPFGKNDPAKTDHGLSDAKSAKILVLDSCSHEHISDNDCVFMTVSITMSYLSTSTHHLIFGLLIRCM